MSVTLTVTTCERGPGHHTTIVESPYAEALATIDGLATAQDDATFRGVRFGAERQGELVMYLKLDYSTPAWREIRSTGRGQYAFEESYLADILSAAAKIESAIANAVPATPDYPCRGHADGCGAPVKNKGSYCQSCQHDSE